MASDSPAFAALHSLGASVSPSLQYFDFTADPSNLTKAVSAAAALASSAVELSFDTTGLRVLVKRSAADWAKLFQGLTGQCSSSAVVLVTFPLAGKDLAASKVQTFLQAKPHAAAIRCYVSADAKLFQIIVRDVGSSLTEFATVISTLLRSDYMTDDHKHADDHTDNASGELQEFPVQPWWHHAASKLVSLIRSNQLEPAYVYSLAQVQSNIKKLKTLTSIDRIFYAMKANFNEAILRCIHHAGIGFEVVSKEELLLIIDLFPSLARNHILFTPNFAPRDEYVLAFDEGVIVNLDNIYPLMSWPDLFAGKEVCMRIDPGEGHGHHAHVRTGGARSKFGVSFDQLPTVHSLLKEHNVRVVGLHIHAGSGVFDVSNWTKNIALFTTLRDQFPHLRFMDLGGGLGVPYRPTDTPLDVQALDQELNAFKASHVEQLKGIQLWMEPGRYIVADAAVLLGTVTQLKAKPGKNFVGINTGMNALIRPALYDSYHHIVNLSRWPYERQALQRVDVVGPICETGDFLGHDRLLPVDTAEGDVICICTAGAYGYCMSSSYNLRTTPEEIILAED